MVTTRAGCDARSLLRLATTGHAGTMGEIAEKRRAAIARGVGGVGRGTAIAAALALVGCGSSGATIEAGDGAAPSDGSVEADVATALDASGTVDASQPGDAASSDGLAWTSSADGGCPTPGPPYGGGEATVGGGMITATLVDPSGTPLSGFTVQICGLNACPQPRSTDGAGVVTIDTTGIPLQKPVLGYGDAHQWPLLLVPVPLGSRIDLGSLVTAALPTAGAALKPGGDAVSGDVTVSLPPGGAAFVDGHIYTTPDAQALRAVSIPVAKATAIPGVAANSLALLYGVAPIDTLFCPAAKVTVANRAGWPAGARVGFYILGDDTAQPWAPYGDWALISHGVVSADGATIATADGEGFPLLEAFGVRLER
jgi:hypothetical protein